MTPSDILPYFFAIEPAPTDARSVFAVATPVAEGAEVGISVMIEDQSACTEIFRFSGLGFVRVAWSADGHHLAFAHNSTLMVRDTNGALHLTPLAEGVQWLGFDGHQRLWHLAGRRLAFEQGQLTTAIDSVESATASEGAAYCRREEDGLCVYAHDGNDARRLGCFSESIADVTTQLSWQGDYLAVVLVSATVDDRARVRIVRFDVTTGQAETLLDERLAFGFNGGPGIKAAALSSGDVLAVYENGACSRVWTLTPGTYPEPISPDGFEVFDFAIDSSGTRLAVIASDTRTPLGGFERQLLVGQKAPTGWQFAAAVAGVHEMPRWRQDGQLELLCGDGGRWTRRVFALDAAETRAGSRWCQGTTVARDNVDYDFVRLPGPERRRAGIILLPRLHQQYVAGGQSFFFHHLLFSIARDLALDGYRVVVLSGPGAIGRGRARREPAGSYFAQSRAAINDLTQSLRAEGCRSVGILAGSLAAVTALRVAGPGTPLSACALLAPLFEATIPVTRTLRGHLVDDPLVEPFDDAARRLAVPLLVIHGACDEVAPLWQVFHLRQRVRDVGMVELGIVEEEGHIFKQTRSWHQAQTAIAAFFSTHLAAASPPAGASRS